MRALSIFTAALCLLACPWAGAEDVAEEGAEASPSRAAHPYLAARHSLSLGAIYQKVDSELRASVPNLPAVSVNLKQLGVDDTDLSWMAEYRWRFHPRWMFIVAAYTFENDGAKEARRDFNFDGVEYEAGLMVKTEVEIDTYIADVMYSVYNTDRSEIMLGGGLHMIDLSLSLQGSGFIGDVNRETEKGTEDLLAPLPNIRLQGFHALTGKWGIGANMGWLSANYEDFEGGFAYIHARTMYRFHKNFGISLGYQFTKVDVTHEGDNGRETEFNTDFNGPTLQITYTF